MNCEESIKWLDSLIKTLGQSQYQSLWNWEQPLTEIKEMLESKRVVELPCKVGDTVYHYCKSVNQIVPYVYDAIAQAKSDAKQDEIPVVMHRKDKCDWLVTMSLDDFMKIYKESDYCENWTD